jgi:hypothetical protein
MVIRLRPRMGNAEGWLCSQLQKAALNTSS